LCIHGTYGWDFRRLISSTDGWCHSNSRCRYGNECHCCSCYWWSFDNRREGHDFWLLSWCLNYGLSCQCLYILGVDVYWQQTITGLILLAAVLGDVVRNKKR